ncbi:MAG: type II secretion system F family protein [Nanoarchaeota archaeon]|nr:type II secretion system F family protein [Nanoarchaeota archaeon]MBU1027473.1 type II secretion system F family protein [Nanoarchaeota archaeon]
MKFRIPLSITSDIEILKRRSKNFVKFTNPKPSKLDEYLKDTDANINRRQYLAICYRYFVFNLLTLTVISTSLFGIFQARLFYIYGLIPAFLISGFILANQAYHPKMYSMNKAKNIEKNLISVLQDMLVQLNSGIPMFRILVNIAEADYQEASKVFGNIVKEINTGISHIEAIEKYGKSTNSQYLKRVLWQISNGMRSGSDMTQIIKEGIKSLVEEQTIQTQQYGGRLNPLIMFYMLIAVILPALGITFLIIISSILSLEEKIMQGIFAGIFGVVVLIQIMFLGAIKSRRPSLL